MSKTHFSSVDLLRSLSVETDSELNREHGSAFMRWNRKYATGISRAFEINSGINVVIHDCLFVNDFTFKEKGLNNDCVSFIYCLNGSIQHQFVGDEGFVDIEQKQNVIIQSTEAAPSRMIFPRDVKIKISIIYIQKDKIEQDNSDRGRYLNEGLKDIFVLLGENNSYRYFGAINSKSVQYAQPLYNNKLDFVGRLIMEAAALNVMGHQIAAHNVAEEMAETTVLTDHDLKVILELSDYIGNNLDKSLKMSDFMRYAGMSPAKIQKGFKYFFSETVNQFVRNARMHKAKELIELTKLTMSEISYSVGISSRSYFSKEFSNYYGVSPKAYRQSLEVVRPHYELCYHSNAMDGLTEKDILDILATARDFNRKNNISGCLLYHDKSFFQILEGSRPVILDLVTKIEKDKRHQDVVTIWKGFKAFRSFKDWSMGYLDANTMIGIDKSVELKKFDFLEIIEKDMPRVTNKKMFWQQVKKHLTDYMKSA